MIAGHDPFTGILDWLYSQFPNEGMIASYLRSLQPVVRALRLAYSGPAPASVDYANPLLRQAYMLAYFPYHIEPIRFLLESCPPDVTARALGSPRLSMSFLAGGPAPEILGVLSFIDEHCPEVRDIWLNVYEPQDAWFDYQRLSAHTLSQSYWQGVRRLSQFSGPGCDLTGSCDWCYSQRACTTALGRSRLLVLQNCLLEIRPRAASFLRGLLGMFSAAPSGALLALLDLAYPDVEGLMVQIEDVVQQSGLGTIVKRASLGVSTVQLAYSIPDILLDNLFTGEEGLQRRRYTRFYSSIMVRT